MKTTKKYIVGTGIVAAVLAVGGTAAFFTDSDSITNPFATGKTDNETDQGIDVIEDFRTLAAEESYTLLGVDYINQNPIRGFEEYDNDDDVATDKEDFYGEKPDSFGPTGMLPGELFVKQMTVASRVDYNQYLRIMPVIEFDGAPITLDIAAIKIDVDSGTPYVEIMLPDAPGKLIIELDPTVLSDWTLGADGYFYYNSVFAPDTYTGDIVKSVVITADAENDWQNKTLDITIEAESIQATNDAWAVWSLDAGVGVPQPVVTP